MDAPSTEKTGLHKGDVIEGKLVIEGVIGDGRISTVIAAVDRDTKKKVAVKVLRVSDLESVERFRRAARGMAKLTSPHAVRVLKVGSIEDGSPCMCMEYLEGKTLAQRLVQGGPLPIDEAVRWMIQAGEAIAEAHGQKLLHRDIDAENLFLAMPRLGSSAAPSIRVLDFGIAPVWRLGKGDGRAKPGEVPGTSLALAPELARGSDLDERVDVWGVGACLYRLLTNRYPYSARNLAELCTRILGERAPDVTKARPEVTPALAAIVARCLEREPGDRFASVQDVIDALAEARDEAPNTPQVPTQQMTLDEMRMTPRAQPVAGPAETPDSMDDDTSVFAGISESAKRTPNLASMRTGPQLPPVKTPTKPPAALPPPPVMTPTSQVPPPSLGAPETIRTAPPPMSLGAPHAFEPTVKTKAPVFDVPAPGMLALRPKAPHFDELATQLEPPKKKLPSTKPPPLKVQPPTFKRPTTPPPPLDPVPEDGPSTQPLGRVSPFAPTTSSSSVETVKPESDPTMKPQLAPTKLPLPKPSPLMMAQETLQGPAPALPRAQAADPEFEDPTTMMARPPAARAALSSTASLPPVFPTPKIDHSERMPALLSPMELAPVAPLASGPPAPLYADAVMTGPPPPLVPYPAEEPPRKRRGVVIALVFALGIAASIVIGLYVARATMPPPAPVATKASGAPPAVTSEPSAEVAEQTTTPEPDTSSDTVATATSASAPAHHSTRVKQRPAATLPTSRGAVGPTPPPAKSGSIYDPGLY